MSLTLTTSPIMEPVSLDDLKSWLGQYEDDDNALLQDLIIAARQYLESVMWRQFITATYTWKIDEFPHQMFVPKPNLITVTSISYVDFDGATQILAGTEYQVVTGENGYICEAYNKTWPTTRSQPEAVTVVYTAGYGATPVTVPQPIRHAILSTAAHWYLDRSCMGASLPPSVMATVAAFQSRDTRRLMGV